MLKFEDIESVVESQLRTLMTRHPASASALRSYKISGGAERPWVAAGIYAYVNAESRLVLEALYLEQFDACVVRVFLESPLEFFYGRKTVSDLSSCSGKIAKAAEHFQLHLPKDLLPVQDHDVAGDWPELDALLGPLPPPFDFATLPE
jgi:hypothetical protein